MPSKSYNGNSPLGGDRITGGKGLDHALGRMADDVARRTPKQSMTTGLVQTHNGAIHAPKRRARSGQSTSCALGSLDGDPDTPGKVIISPGWLHAPNKSVLIEPQSMTPTANHKVWIKCPWTATLNDDDVLEAGGELGTPVVEGGPTMPENVVPHVAELTGTFYVPLGAWDADKKWIREGCGSITVSFCPRVFSVSRGESA